MKKVIVGIFILLVVGIGGYYGSFFFWKTMVNEALPMNTEMKAATSSASTDIAGAVANEPMVLREGTFGKVDFIHKGAGEAKLIRANGSYYIRFEDFRVTNGPDLYVYLAADAENVAKDEYVSLGRLKGTEGSQNYEVRESDVNRYSTVVIWCQQFGVLFSYATLM
ncbi:MAG: DM13 domain-containing protein [Candidatus Sungbacteria bacterium]|nr:DM13 domain-containing protein [Candidatus Sungbacteria bacterium]